ncbi:MAG: polyprenyl synthetase family protein [Fidelibacterota bacterium]
MNSPCRMMTDDFQKKIDDYRQWIDQKMLALVNKNNPAYLYDPIQYVFRGKGKRLRPILVLLVAEMYLVNKEDVLPAALAVEILHNFSLVHDDIMDQDDLRHGMPTVYKKWDESTAILAGDAIFVMAYSHLTHLHQGALDAIRMFNEATLKLCEGQAMDKSFETRTDVHIDDYLEMITLKTGTLLSLCCQLGGLLGGATEDNLIHLSEFGRYLGQSFQIQDDVLEIFSDAKTMGKSLGSDVATSKVTYLSCAARDYDTMAWSELMASLSGKDMESEIIPTLREYMAREGIKSKAESKVEELLQKARGELAEVQVSDKSNLIQLAEMILQRRN